MEYNTQLERMIIPEYGRNIQRMINYCITLESRNERNVCAKAIVQLMGQLNPSLRDADEHHKLWDHLFIISQFKLDVDSPFPIPTAEHFMGKPQKPEYPKGKIKFKHYGKIIEDIIVEAKKIEPTEEKLEITGQIANYLKKSYFNWNNDNINDEVIFKNLNDLSHGALKLSEGTVLSTSFEAKIQKKQFFKKFKKKHKKQRGKF